MASAEKASVETLAAAVMPMEDLVDEAVQVYELDKEKVTVIDDLYNSLKVITTYLSFSVDLQPQLLSLAENFRLILTPSLDIIIIKPDFKSETRRFDQLTLDETANVLKFAIPAIISMVREDRESKNRKVAFLREGAKKLKRLPTSSQDDFVVTDASIQVENVGGKLQ